MTVPCSWPVKVLDCKPFSSLSPDDQLSVEAMATEFLWRWTGRRFGVCDIELRPCRSPAPGASYQGWSQTVTQPALIGGRWFNLPCGQCGDLCSCGAGPSTLTLPGPAVSITSITHGAETVPTSAYRLDGNLLIRLDGRQWPVCQDTTAATGEAGSFVITYKQGTPVPEGGQVAASVLACEMAKRLCNDGTCQLPERVQTVTRQGVTLAMMDNFDDIDVGHTGIWLVDSWVASIMNAPRAPSVRSPDVPSPRHRARLVPPVLAP